MPPKKGRGKAKAKAKPKPKPNAKAAKAKAQPKEPQFQLLPDPSRDPTAIKLGTLTYPVKVRKQCCRPVVKTAA